MSRLDKGLLKDLSTHLGKLEESDYEDNDNEEVSTLPEKLLFPDLQGEPQMRLYRNEEWKKFLRGFLENRHNIKKEKISNKYSEKVYRNMYSKNVLSNKTLDLYTKVLYHPDVTEIDYNYIQGKMSDFPKYVFYNQIGTFLLIGFTFYTTSLGEFVRSNPVFGAVILGLTPMTVLLGTQKLNSYLLNRRLKLMGMPNKYNLTNV